MTPQAPATAAATELSSLMSARTGLIPGAADCDRPRSGCREVARTPKPAACRWRTMRRPRNPVLPKTVTDCAAIVRLGLPYASAAGTAYQTERIALFSGDRFASTEQTRPAVTLATAGPPSPFRGSKRRAFHVMHDTPTVGDLPVVVLCFKGSPALSTARVVIC